MRQIIAIIAIVAVSLIGGNVAAAAPVEQYPAGYDYTCPVGHYPIGNGFCKKEPSGCPFYENVDVKGCIKPSYIECTDDTWTNCWLIDESTAPSAPQTTAPAQTPPTPTAPANPSNSTPNAPNTGNSARSYAAPGANDPTNVNEPAKTVDLANADVNKNEIDPIAIEQQKEAEQMKRTTDAIDETGRNMVDIAIALILLASTVTVIVIAEASSPGYIRNTFNAIKDKFNEFTKRR